MVNQNLSGANPSKSFRRHGSTDAGSGNLVPMENCVTFLFFDPDSEALNTRHAIRIPRQHIQSFRHAEYHVLDSYQDETRQIW